VGRTDPTRLREALAHWKKVEATAGRDGLSFVEGMRLLAGAAVSESAAAPPPETASWSDVIAGRWLKEALDGLRGPEGLRDSAPPAHCALCFDPIRRSASAGSGSSSGWDWRVPGRRHGLGKTVQVLALLLALKERASAVRAPALLVCRRR